MEIVSCTAVHSLADGEAILLGAVDTVTGSMTRVELAGHRLLIDCGMRQGREAKNWEFPDAARDVDAVLLTHGHLVHIGSLPTLLEHGFDKPILATKATLDIARISLRDSLNMQRVSDKEMARFEKRFNELVRPIAYDSDGSHIKGMPIRMCFREAGHILGSASIEIATDKSRILLSGDLGRPGSPILRDPFTEWKDDRAFDLVVMESTYGHRDHEHGPDDIEATLLRVVQETVAKKGKVLIPSFAIGRTQVLLWHLNTLVESHRLQKVPVALDTPMGLLVTETYARARRLYDKEALDKIAHGDDPLDFDTLFSVKRGTDSLRIRDTPGPMIVIAGAGMCNGGRIVGHLKDGLPDEKNTVLFVGHQSVGTPGRRIQEAASAAGSVWLDGEEVLVRARIESLRGLSAHADRKELKAWVSAIPHVKRLALNHGEVEAQKALEAYLQDKPVPTPSHEESHGQD